MKACKVKPVFHSSPKPGVKYLKPAFNLFYIFSLLGNVSLNLYKGKEHNIGGGGVAHDQGPEEQHGRQPGRAGGSGASSGCSRPGFRLTTVLNSPQAAAPYNISYAPMYVETQ